jgi:hypothetical protein
MDFQNLHLIIGNKNKLYQLIKSYQKVIKKYNYLIIQ